MGRPFLFIKKIILFQLLVVFLVGCSKFKLHQTSESSFFSVRVGKIVKGACTEGNIISSQPEATGSVQLTASSQNVLFFEDSNCSQKMTNERLTVDGGARPFYFILNDSGPLRFFLWDESGAGGSEAFEFQVVSTFDAGDNSPISPMDPGGGPNPSVVPVPVTPPPVVRPTPTPTPTRLPTPTPSSTPVPSPQPPPPITDEVTQACQAWKAVNVTTGVQWTGDVQSCVAGTISDVARNQTLALVNYYRAMAKLPTVNHDSTRNKRAQECALMMNANRALNHFPPSSWSCYTSAGALSAGKSNLAPYDSVRSVAIYMMDSGNATTLGHRRWILSNWLSTIGIGSTSEFSCLDVSNLVGAGSARAWTAWPPPDVPVPISAMNVDSTGWSLQSDQINLNNANVQITEGGTVLPVSVTALSSNYGSTHAISIIPSGWRSQAGRTYQVSVTGIFKPISYSVRFVACP